MTQPVVEIKIGTDICSIKRIADAYERFGTRFVERILTISATCAQQHRHLLTFLTAAVDASWRGQPAPNLV